MNPGTNLEAVDELGKGDIVLVTEHVQSLKVIGLSTVPELDADEVPVFRGGAGTDFNGESRSIVGHTLEFGMLLHDIGHVEE